MVRILIFRNEFISWIHVYENRFMNSDLMLWIHISEFIYWWILIWIWNLYIWIHMHEFMYSWIHVLMNSFDHFIYEFSLWIHLNSYMNSYIYVCICIYICVCVCVCVYEFVCVCVCEFIYELGGVPRCTKVADEGAQTVDWCLHHLDPLCSIKKKLSLRLSLNSGKFNQDTQQAVDFPNQECWIKTKSHSWSPGLQWLPVYFRQETLWVIKMP